MLFAIIMFNKRLHFGQKCSLHSANSICFTALLPSIIMIMQFSYVVYYLLGNLSRAFKTKIIVSNPKKKKRKRSCNVICMYVFFLWGPLTHEVFSIRGWEETKVAFCSC